MIKFSCAKCGREFEVRDDVAGRKGNCKTCKAEIIVPSAKAEFQKLPKPVSSSEDDGFNVKYVQPSPASKRIWLIAEVVLFVLLASAVGLYVFWNPKGPDGEKAAIHAEQGKGLGAAEPAVPLPTEFLPFVVKDVHNLNGFEIDEVSEVNGLKYWVFRNQKSKELIGLLGRDETHLIQATFANEENLFSDMLSLTTASGLLPKDSGIFATVWNALVMNTERPAKISFELCSFEFTLNEESRMLTLRPNAPGAVKTVIASDILPLEFNAETLTKRRRYHIVAAEKVDDEHRVESLTDATNSVNIKLLFSGKSPDFPIIAHIFYDFSAKASSTNSKNRERSLTTVIAECFPPFKETQAELTMLLESHAERPFTFEFKEMVMRMTAIDDAEDEGKKRISFIITKRTKSRR